MSDDMWRRRREHGDETDEFGGPLFPDEEPSNSTQRPSEGDDTGERRLSFGPNDTGPLPHWTEPPTGEVPRLEPSTVRRSGGRRRRRRRVVVLHDGIAGVARRRHRSERRAATRRLDVDSTGQVYTDDLSTPIASPRTGEQPATTPPRREPGRITIGTDPSGVPRRPPAGTSRRRSAQQRSGRPAGPARTAAGAGQSGRNLPAAVIAGVVLAALFVVATLWRPAAVLALVTVILAVAAFEYFGKVTEKGYRPAVAPGLAACVAAPLAAYWVGAEALPLVVAFAFIAASVGFLGASGVESGPLPNMAVTTMGVVWIGLLGSFAALILGWSNQPGAREHWHRHDVPDRARRRRQRHRRVARRLGRRQDAAARLDQPGQDRRGVDRRHVHDVPRPVRRRPHRPQRHVDDARSAAPGVDHLGLRAARRPGREHVQAQPRREGLRHGAVRARRRPRPLRLVLVRAPGRLLHDARARTLDRDRDVH